MSETGSQEPLRLTLEEAIGRVRDLGFMMQFTGASWVLYTDQLKRIAESPDWTTVATHALQRIVVKRDEYQEGFDEAQRQGTSLIRAARDEEAELRAALREGWS